MTIFYTQFTDDPPPVPRQLQAVVPAAGGRGYLVHTWDLNEAAGGYDQRRPEKRSTLAGALALKPPYAQWYPVPPDFAFDAWAVL